MMTRSLLLAALALVSATSLAHARPTVEQPQLADDGGGAGPVEVVDRYGGQILLADLAGLSLLGAGGLNNSSTMMTAGMLVSGVAPAAIHIANGHGSGVLASLLLRPALVTAGAMAGGLIAGCVHSEGFCGLEQAAAGAIIGYGVAAVVDAVYVARVTRRSGSRSLAPQVAVTDDGVRVGLGGTF